MSPRLPPLSPAYLSGEIQEALDLVNRVIEKIRYERLKLTLLEGVNPEINTDREVLVSRIDELGFRHDIVEALGELDRKLAAAGKPLDFKGCMDLARTILEELIEDAARSCPDWCGNREVAHSSGG